MNGQIRTPSQMQFFCAADERSHDEIDAIIASLGADFDLASDALDVVTDAEEAEYLKLHLRDIWKNKKDWHDVIEYRRGRDNAIAGSKMGTFFL